RRQDLMDPVADDFVLARRHHVGSDGDARIVAGASAASTTSAATTPERDTRLGRIQNVRDLFATDPKLGGIPRDPKPWAVIREASRLAHGSLDAIDLGDARGDIIEPRNPHGHLGLVVALHPHLDRGEHAYRLLLTELHRAAVAMMRGTAHPCGLH